jgi:ketosteroid isomerase-like protein
MSQENVEMVRRGLEAAWHRPKPDFATINALFHPDHELVSFITLRGGESLRGADGFRAWLSDVDETLDSWVNTSEQVRAIDETRVLALQTLTLEGKRSGIPYEQHTAVVMTLRSGKIVRTEIYATEAEALEAVEPRE